MEVKEESERAGILAYTHTHTHTHIHTHIYIHIYVALSLSLHIYTCVSISRFVIIVLRNCILNHIGKKELQTKIKLTLTLMFTYVVTFTRILFFFQFFIFKILKSLILTCVPKHDTRILYFLTWFQISVLHFNLKD